MRGLAAALRFLTVLPLPGRLGASGEELAGSVPWFPVVGVFIGLGAAGVAWLAFRFAPPAVAAVLVVIALAAVSKGLHLDGLADAADGLLSSRTRERMLEIMKDSRIGVMGVLALLAVLGLKVTALASLEPGQAWAAALLMPVAGRCAMTMLMGVLPYARPEGGLGALFALGKNPAPAIWALLVMMGVGLAVGHGMGLVAMGMAAGVAAVFGWQVRRVLGGMTGDTLGAVCEIAEMVPVVAMAMWAGR